MEFKGTKGKWWNPEFSTEIISMPSQTKVAKTDGNSYEEVRANARLISFVPEMLEMLESTMDLLDAYPNESEIHLKAVQIRELITIATTI